MVNLLGRTGGSRRCFSFERKMMDVGTELAHLWGTADYDCLRTTNYFIAVGLLLITFVVVLALLLVKHERKGQ